MFGASYINLDVIKGTSVVEYKIENVEYWTFDATMVTQAHQESE